MIPQCHTPALPKEPEPPCCPYPVDDSLIVIIRDAPLCSSVLRNAAAQNATADELVTAALRHCDRLGLLSSAMCRGPEDKAKWGIE